MKEDASRNSEQWKTIGSGLHSMSHNKGLTNLFVGPSSFVIPQSPQMSSMFDYDLYPSDSQNKGNQV